MKAAYDAKIKAHRQAATEAGAAIENSFTFLENAFGDGQEMVIFVTELTVNMTCTWYISHYGSAKYFAHNKELLFYERQKSLIESIARIDDTELGEK